MREYFLLIIVFISLNILNLYCKKQDEKVTLSILGTGITGNYYYFEGEIDQDITPYCGDVKTSSSGSTSSSSGSSSGSSNQTQFDIESFYRFKFGDYMQLRYTYDINRRKFSLVPTTTTISTCNTVDFINCNASGSAICETADGIKCGGSKTFIFVGVVNPIQFQAVSGTIDWSKGYALTSDNKYVQKANLEFSMVDKNGNVLQGKVYCYSQL
jgi:hypothetical protein